MYSLISAFVLFIAQAATPTYELRNGHWLEASGFRARVTYVAHGRITLRRPARVDSIIDLQGAYVIPPFGEAHNHNIDYSGAARTDSLLNRYLRDGVFYVKNPGILPRGRDSMVSRINKPTSVDAIFSLGLLTATGGHPSGLWKRNVARGGMTIEDGDGGFIWLIDTREDLDRKFPLLLAQHPDFIKAVLVHSEEYDKRVSDTTYFNWKALNPALLPEVVRKAHAAQLRVSTHVETAADFHAALVAGVDEINHTPGFRGNERSQLPQPEMFEVTEADAKLAAQRGVVVVTTLGGAASIVEKTLRAAFDKLAARNLRVLRDAGVHLAIGSDVYRDDSSAEVAYLMTLGVFDNLQMVRLWSEATPRAIFPRRKVGCLAEGCEASFLALNGDPRQDFAKVRDIQWRMKDGLLLKL
ncbi:MAG TPA: amidohydrolase family protein [Longimicrobiales bacterium]|nr:amidohydrolase family protein [Longimicrobiales bacterium]